MLDKRSRSCYTSFTHPGGETVMIDKIFPHIPRCICCGIEKGVSGCLCEKCGSGLSELLAGKSDTLDYSAYSIYQYDGAVKRIIKAYKYGGQKWLCGYMGQELSKAALNEFENIDFVCHVPLHKKRRANRGFDQAEELAKRVCEITGIPFVPALRRIKNTKTQTKLNEKQRKQNIQGAFESTGHVSENALLIDDILTTGATACECAKVLVKAGAKNVCILTFAKSTYEKKAKRQ